MNMELEELKEKFAIFLRERLGMTGYANASKARNQRLYYLEKLYRETGASHRIGRIYDEAKNKLEFAEGNQRKLLEDICCFMESILPVSEEIIVHDKTIDALTYVQEEEAEQKIVSDYFDLGRVSPTQQTPADPLRFSFWVKPGVEISLGDILVADGKNAENQSAISVGVVHKLERIGLYRSPIDHYMAYDMGNPQADIPTRLPFIMVGECGILWRSDGRNSPPSDDWRLRWATAEELRRAISGGIPRDYAVPAGFVSLPEEKLVPVDMDLRWLAGYESGHVNIAGISGVAAKTSYGIFLTLGILATNRSEEVKKSGGVAVIAFNVKELDLLYIGEVKGWEKAPKEFEKDVIMWNKLKNDYNIDPDKILEKVRYFAPGSSGRPLSLRNKDITAFNYGWSEMKKRENRQAFYALFDPDDLDDKMVGAIEGVTELKCDTFQSIEKELGQALKTKGGNQSSGEWTSLGGVGVHRATLAKLLSRLRFIKDSLGGLLTESEPNGDPLVLEQLRPGDLWVIDITQIGERARRYLFYLVLRGIGQLLQKRKAGIITDVPGRVVVIVDELNAFAPAGAGRHPTKGEIAHIATQGRSYGLTLLGMQQMASRVDESVLTNSANFIVGRAHPSELSGPAYGWMSKTLREQVAGLPPGTMLAYHPKWRQPVFVNFPRRPDQLAKEAKKVSE